MMCESPPGSGWEAPGGTVRGGPRPAKSRFGKGRSSPFAQLDAGLFRDRLSQLIASLSVAPRSVAEASTGTFTNRRARRQTRTENLERWERRKFWLTATRWS